MPSCVKQPLVRAVRIVNRPKGRFDGIGRPKTRQMGSGKGVEGQQRFPIFLQTGGGLWILHCIGFDEDLEQVLCCGLGWGLPDLL